MNPPTDGVGPYRGIVPFRYIDRHVFFGREQFLEEFLAQILAFRLVILFGKSGAGKSSLINAGLIPALQKEGLSFDRLRIGSEADAPLKVERIPTTERQDGAFLPSVLAGSDTPRLVPLSLDVIETRLRKRHQGALRPVLLFDQFEEVFTRFGSRRAAGGEVPMQRSLLEWLVRILNDDTIRAKIVIAVREDYFGQLQTLAKQYPRVIDHRLQLRELEAPQARMAILGPFTGNEGSLRFDSHITSDLADEIVSDLQESGHSDLVNPTDLQIVCERLWKEYAPKQREIAPPDYKKLNGAEGILRRFLDVQLGDLSGSARGAALNLLTSLVTPDGTRDVVSEARLIKALGSEPATTILDQLSDRRLVLRTEERGTTFWQLTTEYMIPPLREEAQRLEIEAQRRTVEEEVAQAEDRRKREIILLLAGAANEIELAGKGLSEIPEELFELRQLRSLKLCDNHIHVVPERIRDLPNLQRLDLAGNPVDKVPNVPGLILDWDAYVRCRQSLSPENVLGINLTPDQIAESSTLMGDLAALPNLRVLRAGRQRVPDPAAPLPTATDAAQLTGALARFYMLEELSLVGLPLGEVPEGIRSLAGLRRLALCAAGIHTLPEWFGEIGELVELVLNENELEQLPPSLGHLQRLETIDLKENAFAQFPEVLIRLRSLAWIGLSCKHRPGRITHVPATIVDLIKLKTLELDGQPIDLPPAEVVQRGADAIRSYWRLRQEAEAGSERLYEAKLILIGEGGVGKTTLARKIIDANHELKRNETLTHGLQIQRWIFPTSERRHSKGGHLVGATEFRVNLWDFGGQEIYHATNQFFFTRRSLYVFVTDDRREEPDFDYWLQLVELLGDASPLFIVQNKRHDRSRELDLPALRSRYHNIKGVYPVNLKDNTGLPQLVRAMQAELESLPHIGATVPATWKRVRESIESDVRNYVGIDEYLSRCRQFGLIRREDALQLSSYLHDLGLCLHFQDDPRLKTLLILNPTWATEAVWLVLNDGRVIEQRGRFGRKDVERIWSAEKYADMHDELLRLMMKFELCYELPGGEQYLVPQLLSIAQPPYVWSSAGNTVLVYQYEFLPKWIITRLIVSLGHLMAEPSLVWRHGVVLDRNNTRAEVIEDSFNRAIRLRVEGAESRRLLTIVDESLERIHNSVPRLKYERLLPCNCSICKGQDNPHTYRLSALQKFAASGTAIQCQRSYELVDASALIHDLLPASLPATGERGPAVDIDTQAARITGTGDAPREVFVSFAWTEESRALVDSLKTALDQFGIKVLLPRDEVRYRDAIRSFKRRLGRGKAVVVVLSRSYLQSTNCMFELTEIVGSSDIADRVYPIVLADANVFDAASRLDYVLYWEMKMRDLETKVKSLAGDLSGIREEMDLLAKIRSTIARLGDILPAMNALTLSAHREYDVQQLVLTLRTRLLT